MIDMMIIVLKGVFMTKEELNALPPYERKAYKIFREMCSPDDEPDTVKVISYFVKRNNNETPVSGKVFVPKETTYEKQVDLSWAFARIKEKMVTKQGKLRKTMGNLKPHEVNDLANLLYYLRQCWTDGEDVAMLTWKEYFLLHNKGDKE